MRIRSLSLQLCTFIMSYSYV
uniref:Uncharacterized protein n=1 Tax=Anguilla anguilla TaxID=7936 RepID=A0A0E9UHP5_ANGAN